MKYETYVPEDTKVKDLNSDKDKDSLNPQSR